MRLLLPALALFALALGFSCASTSDAPPHLDPLPRPAVSEAKAVDLPGLHNVVAYTDSMMSGSQPEHGGLETLAAMGIKTIISVDGAQPEVEAAQRLGMRYVHLPIGYDGIDDARKLELARVVRDLPGPIYVHCHHGKHRSAGAAAAIGLSLGTLDTTTAAARMKVSGTAPDYKGLWACASDTKPASQAQLDAASNAFPARWKSTGLVQLMVDIDYALENVKAVEKAQWGVPKEHPDLVPAAEVGRISHYLRELEDDSEVKAKGEDFLEAMRATRAAADKLEKAFLDQAAPDVLAADMKKLTSSCKSCHVKFRD
jgi:protein tyrosine phosphatase (PTP) superfamily phosphohydrolase (DUF442 family)